jgi:hypothetical protein
MRPTTRALIEDVAARHGVQPADILSHRMPRRLLAARVEIAKTLEARGYNGPQIGAVLRRDYTTAYFLLGRTRRQPKLKPPQPKPAPKPVAPPQPSFPIRYAGWDRTETHQ